jgi:acetyl esterase
MSLHPHTRAVLDFMASMGSPKLEDCTPEEGRQLMKAAIAEGEPVREVRDVDAGGVPARLYHPSAEVTGLLVFFHGGGWVIGDLETHDATCRALANRSGHAVLAVDYRLAPEHKFPAPLDDCVAATVWAHANAATLRTDSERLAVGGDSAGGNLAAVVATMGIAPLRYQLLVYPVTDLSRRSASYEANGEGYLLTKGSMEWFHRHYLDGTDIPNDDARVSPLLQTGDVLRKAPPGLVITAEFDPLRDEGEAYASRLNAAGVPTTSVRFGGQIHAFFGMPGIADGATAVGLAANALRAALA